jgi:hypothetical protein
VYGDGKWAALITHVANALYRMHGRERAPLAITTAIAAIALGSAEFTFITTQLVNSSPWPAAAAIPSWTVAHSLGTMFDRDVASPRAAPFCDAWAESATTILGGVVVDWWTLLPPPARAALLAAHWRLPE